LSLADLFGTQHLEHRLIRQARVATRRFDRGVTEEALQVALGDAASDRVRGEGVLRTFVETDRGKPSVLDSAPPDGLQRLVWRNPEFDYNQVRPNNPIALAAYSESYTADRRSALREIAQDYGLYFFVSGNCAYCHAMAPYLKRFAEAYGFVVIAVSVDGGSVDEFPNARYSPEFAEQLDVKQTPAIFLAKPNEHIVEPIADWSTFENLEFEVWSPADHPVVLRIRIEDRAHDGRVTDRYSGGFSVRPGANRVVIPLEEVRRGPHNRETDMTRIAALRVFQSRPEGGGTFYFADFVLR